MSTDVRARVRKGVSVESFVVCQDCGCEVSLPRELDDLAGVPLACPGCSSLDLELWHVLRVEGEGAAA